MISQSKEWKKVTMSNLCETMLSGDAFDLITLLLAVTSLRNTLATD